MTFHFVGSLCGFTLQDLSQPRPASQGYWQDSWTLLSHNQRKASQFQMSSLWGHMLQDLGFLITVVRELQLQFQSPFSMTLVRQLDPCPQDPSSCFQGRQYRPFLKQSLLRKWYKKLFFLVPIAEDQFSNDVMKAKSQGGEWRSQEEQLESCGNR